MEWSRRGAIGRNISVDVIQLALALGGFKAMVRLGFIPTKVVFIRKQESLSILSPDWSIIFLAEGFRMVGRPPH